MAGPDASPTDPQEAALTALMHFWRDAGLDMEDALAAAAALARQAPSAPHPSSSRRSPAPAGALARPPVRPGRAGTSPVDNARALAAAAGSVAELRQAVGQFDGCALKATARTTVFSDGIDAARVLLIGEAPGKEEDEQGKPFVGRSGQLLDRQLAAIGLDRRHNLLISNTIFWRPPGNRPPTQGETAVCLPFVERLIELVAPALLILAGGTAGQIVLRREEGVMRMRGRRLVYNREGLQSPVNTMVMLHPAYLLRRPQEKRLAWADLLMLEAWLDELDVAREPAL